MLSEIQPELARAARLSRLFFTPAFSSLLVRALDESEGIRDVFVDLVGGVQPYRGLRRRLLATRQWALAARAIRMLLTPGFTGTMTASRYPTKCNKESDMGRIGLPELFIILFIVVLIFGANRLPQLATGIGKSIRSFKDGMKEGDDNDIKKT